MRTKDNVAVVELGNRQVGFKVFQCGACNGTGIRAGNENEDEKTAIPCGSCLKGMTLKPTKTPFTGTVFVKGVKYVFIPGNGKITYEAFLSSYPDFRP
jgi:hypothetical protein